MNSAVDKIHLKAPECWINDPNGFIYYQGQYHLFYQCFPYSVQWGRMHWGHAVSNDLVCWKHLGIALFPSKYDDKDGCFSGSAIEYNNILYLFYTGVRYLKEDPENTNLCIQDQYVSSQMMMVSPNGAWFDNIKDKKMIIPSFRDSSVGSTKDTRDPKVWRGSDSWYMLVGSCTKTECGQLLFFKSDDLENWELINRVQKNKEWGTMWECPDYFKIGNEEILLISPLNILKDGKKENAQTILTIVKFEEETCKMKIPDSYQYFDYGFDLYAPQTALDKDGKRTVIAWARMPKPVKNKWCGMFCIPRTIEVKNGHIFFEPHKNIRKKFRKKINSISQASDDGFQIKCDMREGDNISIGGYQIFIKNHMLYTDRSEVFGDFREYRKIFHTPEISHSNSKIAVEIYVDSNLIEVYVNEGEYVITNVVYDLEQKLYLGQLKKVEIYTTR